MASIIEIIARGKNEAAPLFESLGQGVERAKSELGAFRQEADKNAKSFQLSAGEIGKWAAGFVTAQAVIGGVKAAFGAVVDFVGDSVKEFAEAEKAQRLLTTAMRNQGTAIDATIGDYAKLGKEFQRTTVYGDDLIAEMQALLIQVGGVMPRDMKAALKASTDLASGLGIDLRQATMLVGKAFAGETGSLSRFGIVVDESAIKARGADAVLQAIQSRFGGQAQAEVETYAGSVAQLSTAWGDVKEGLGELIATDPIVQVALRGMKRNAEDAGQGADVWREAIYRADQMMGPFGLNLRANLTLLGLWADRANVSATAARRLAALPVPAIFEADRGAELGVINEALARVNETLDAAEKKQEAAKKAAEEHERALDGIRETLTGKGAIRSMNDWVRLVQEIGGVMSLAEEAQEAYSKQLQQGVSYLTAAGKAVPTMAFLDWLQVTKVVGKDVNEYLVGMIDHLTTIKELAPPAAVAMGSLVGPLQTELEKMPGLFQVNLATPAQSFNEDLLAMARESAETLVGIGQEVGSAIGGWFGDILNRSMGLLSQLAAAGRSGASGLTGWLASPGGRNTIGAIGLGVQTFGQGYSLGGLTSNRGVGTAIGAGSGAATGAMIGTFVMPGIGTAAGAGIGAIAGAIGGWIGSNKKKKEEEAALKELQASLLETFKGMDNLRKVAGDVGINIDKAFDMKDRKGAIKTIEAFTEALDKKNQRLEAVAVAQVLVTEKTAIFAAGLEKATAITEADQAAFDRLGRQIITTFQAGIRETGDFFGTMEQLGPGIDNLAKLQERLGFTSSDTLTRLLSFRDVVTANADVGQSIQINTGLMEAYKAASMMTADTLVDFAADAKAHYDTLIERGVDSKTVMILQQKELQGLWEQQKKFGSITDEATLALLKEAEAQGIVGEAQRSVNDRMLDTLIGIQTAVKDLAKIFRGDLVDAAEDGASGIEDAFRRRGPVRVPIEFEYPDGYQQPEQPNPNGYAVGGTVPFTPGGRIVRVAEAGTEHILSPRQVHEIAARVVADALGEIGGRMGAGDVTVFIGDRQVDAIVETAANRGLRNGRIRVPERQVMPQVF